MTKDLQLTHTTGTVSSQMVPVANNTVNVRGFHV